MDLNDAERINQISKVFEYIPCDTDCIISIKLFQ